MKEVTRGVSVDTAARADSVRIKRGSEGLPGLNASRKTVNHQAKTENTCMQSMSSRLWEVLSLGDCTTLLNSRVAFQLLTVEYSVAELIEECCHQLPEDYSSLDLILYHLIYAVSSDNISSSSSSGTSQLPHLVPKLCAILSKDLDIPDSTLNKALQLFNILSMTNPSPHFLLHSFCRGIPLLSHLFINLLGQGRCIHQSLILINHILSENNNVHHQLMMALGPRMQEHVHVLLKVLMSIIHEQDKEKFVHPVDEYRHKELLLKHCSGILGQLLLISKGTKHRIVHNLLEHSYSVEITLKLLNLHPDVDVVLHKSTELSELNPFLPEFWQKMNKVSLGKTINSLQFSTEVSVRKLQGFSNLLNLLKELCQFSPTVCQRIVDLNGPRNTVDGILERCRAIDEKQVLSIYKVCYKYFPLSWRSTHMELVSSIWLHLEFELRDDWMCASSTNGKNGDGRMSLVECKEVIAKKYPEKQCYMELCSYLLREERDETEVEQQLIDCIKYCTPVSISQEMRNSYEAWIYLQGIR